MKSKVTVNIVRDSDRITVTNDRGAKWEFLAVEDPNADLSAAGAIANLAASLLCGSLTSHLHYSCHSHISYTLEVNGTL